MVFTFSKNANVGLNNTETLNASGSTTSRCPAVIFVFANLSTTNTDNCLSSGTLENSSGSDLWRLDFTSDSYCLSSFALDVTSKSPNLNIC